MGVQRFDIDRRGHRPVLHAKDGFHQTGNARRRFQMAEVAFHRADQQRLVFRAKFRQGLTQGTGLDRVTDRRAGAMRLDIINFGGVDPGIGIGARQQVRLRPAAGHGEAGFLAIAIDRRSRDHRHHVVAVGDRLIVFFQDEYSAPLGTNVSIPRGVEYAAFSAPGQH